MTEHTGSSGPESLVIRRGISATRLLPPPPPTETTVISRQVLHPRASGTRPETSRERKIAGDLPQWEPLPPGELFVRR